VVSCTGIWCAWQQVGELVRAVADLSRRDIRRAGGHAQRLDLFARARVAEPSDPPRLVVANERFSHPEGYPSRGSGDQNLFIAEQRCPPLRRGKLVEQPR